jgi:RimJ/RimL family protein N-acetyltransferase
MFARTQRLTLRPPWPEDADALVATIGHPDVARMLVRVPHPYTRAHAEEYVARPRDAGEPRFVITAHQGGEPALVGGIAIVDHGDGPELAYWLAPFAWGRGYATEAGRAVVDMARHALPIRRLTAWHFVDNPASGRVLAKLGFRDTGRREPRSSIARTAPATAVVMELDVDLAGNGELDPARGRAMPIAA